MNKECLEFLCHVHLLQNITTENGINFTQEPLCIDITNSSNANSESSDHYDNNFRQELAVVAIFAVM